MAMDVFGVGRVVVVGQWWPVEQSKQERWVMNMNTQMSPDDDDFARDDHMMNGLVLTIFGIPPPPAGAADG